MAADDGRLRAQVNRLKNNHTQMNFCIDFSDHPMKTLLNI